MNLTEMRENALNVLKYFDSEFIELLNYEWNNEAVADEYILIDYLETSASTTMQHLRWTNGASRIVFWDPTRCDCVVKIAREKRYNRYNQNEYDAYVDACNNNVGYAFAGTYKVCEANEYGILPIYAAEFAECDDNQVYSSVDNWSYNAYLESTGKADNDDSKFEYYNSCFSDLEEDSIISYASEVEWNAKDVQTIYDIIMNWNICDMHEANWGYIDGNMVMVDYAGFGWF